MIEVRNKGVRIEISFPYNPDNIAKFETKKSYRWHPEEKCWSVPRSEFKTLLAVFDGKSIAIDPVIHLDELKKELMLMKYSQRTIKQYFQMWQWTL